MQTRYAHADTRIYKCTRTCTQTHPHQFLLTSVCGGTLPVSECRQDTWPGISLSNKNSRLGMSMNTFHARARAHCARLPLRRRRLSPEMRTRGGFSVIFPFGRHVKKNVLVDGRLVDFVTERLQHNIWTRHRRSVWQRAKHRVLTNTKLEDLTTDRSDDIPTPSPYLVR